MSRGAAFEGCNVLGVAPRRCGPSQAVPACLLAAFLATNFESVLGATTQGKLPWLTNEVGGRSMPGCWFIRRRGIVSCRLLLTRSWPCRAYRFWTSRRATSARRVKVIGSRRPFESERRSKDRGRLDPRPFPANPF